MRKIVFKTILVIEQKVKRNKLWPACLAICKQAHGAEYDPKLKKGKLFNGKRTTY